MEKTPKFIAVDTGKFATKAVTLRGDGSERFITFRTKSEETQRSEAQGKSYIVEYKGKWYLFHHDSVPSGGKNHLRSLKVCELEYDENGKIKTIDGLDE